jgi:predicted anti-sigma-YlaC factor YlaD
MAMPEKTDLTCNELVELVTEYLEGALPQNDRLDFEHHLVWCSWCRDYLDQVRTTIELTGTTETEALEPPSPLREHVLDAFRDWKRGREST